MEKEVAEQVSKFARLKKTDIFVINAAKSEGVSSYIFFILEKDIFKYPN